jgi:hypothetical protein
MIRPTLLACVGCFMVAQGAAAAGPEQLPVRKAGLWEVKMVRTGSPIPAVTMQHCTDESTDRHMNGMAAPTAQHTCSKQDIRKTATGYATDSVCTAAGLSITSHAEVVGDFNSAYTVNIVSHAEGGPAGARDTTSRIEAKWLGPCAPDQKPGDMVMPGGRKMNVMDLQQPRGAPSPR